jgi:ubiquinone/menaquinone biosynthesis C-methylase UbiE
MGEAIAERVKRYVLDGTDRDLQRLLSISQEAAEMARAAFRRVGVQEGWSAIECGCGPIGGLAVMAEMVGPGGRIVGIDFSKPAVAQARTVASSLGLSNVEVFEADVNELDPTVVGGTFDLAYTRLFLVHQTNPVQTLRRIADLLRPGGVLVAQEPLPTPPPRAHPDVPALAGYWALLHRLLQRAGVPAGAVEDLPRYAREAGFEVAGMSGYFGTMDPGIGFEIHADTVAATRERATRSGVATEREIDDLILSLRAAKTEDHEWVSSPFFLDLTLRKPVAR